MAVRVSTTVLDDLNVSSNFLNESFSIEKSEKIVPSGLDYYELRRKLLVAITHFAYPGNVRKCVIFRDNAKRISEESVNLFLHGNTCVSGHW